MSSNHSRHCLVMFLVIVVGGCSSRVRDLGPIDPAGSEPVVVKINPGRGWYAAITSSRSSVDPQTPGPGIGAADKQYLAGKSVTVTIENMSNGPLIIRSDKSTTPPGGYTRRTELERKQRKVVYEGPVEMLIFEWPNYKGMNLITGATVDTGLFGYVRPGINCKLWIRIQDASEIDKTFRLFIKRRPSTL